MIGGRCGSGLNWAKCAARLVNFGQLRNLFVAFCSCIKSVLPRKKAKNTIFAPFFQPSCSQSFTDWISARTTILAFRSEKIGCPHGRLIANTANRQTIGTT
jgi:hypothetical protein